MTLTPRQRQVVQLIAEGLSCPQIAARLRIALPTVRQHVKDIASHLPGPEGVPALRRVKQAARRLLEAA